MIRCPCHDSPHLARAYRMAYVSFQLMYLLWWRRGILAEKVLDPDHSSIPLMPLASVYTWMWCRCVLIRRIPVQFRSNICHHLRSDIAVDINHRVILGVVGMIWRKSKRFRRKSLFSGITRAQNERKSNELWSVLCDMYLFFSIFSIAWSARSCLSLDRRASILFESSSIPVNSTTYLSTVLLDLCLKSRKAATRENRMESMHPMNK